MTRAVSRASGYDRPMPLAGHFHELRARLLKVMLALALGTFIGFLATPQVEDYFLSRIIRIAIPPDKPFFGVGSIVGVREYFTIVFAIGVALAMPVILYQAVRFLAPGLTRTEWLFVSTLLPGALLCFAGGIAFALAIVLPRTLSFLLSPGALRTNTLLHFDSLVCFCPELVLWTGIAFALPIMMFLGVVLHVIPHATVRHMHKYVAVGSAIVVALIMPTFDLLAALGIWILLYLPFELGALLSYFARPSDEKPPLG